MWIVKSWTVLSVRIDIWVCITKQAFIWDIDESRGPVGCHRRWRCAIKALEPTTPLAHSLRMYIGSNECIPLSPGLASTGDRVARFSARGMSTWELPWGYGRLKPDVLVRTRVSLRRRVWNEMFIWLYRSNQLSARYRMLSRARRSCSKRRLQTTVVVFRDRCTRRICEAVDASGVDARYDAKRTECQNN